MSLDMRCGEQRDRAAGQQSAAAEDLAAAAAPEGAELPGSAGGLGQRLGAHRAAAGPGDRRQAPQGADSPSVD